MTAVRALTKDVLQARPLPDPSEASDKNSRGRVLAIAGSATVPGAALLTGIASLRAGAGKIQLGVPKSVGAALGVAFPECGLLLLDETDSGESRPSPDQKYAKAVRRADAVVIGPGLMDAAGATALMQKALAARQNGSFVLDALALCEVRGNRDILRAHGLNLVLTPHHGEMATLWDVPRDEVSRDPLGFAKETAADLGCCVVLKSSTTHIVTPRGEAWEHNGGAIGLATAGSGDVLAGIVAGFLARGADPATAALWGVMVHGKAGEHLSSRVAPVGFLAREILEVIPGLLTLFRSK